MDFIHSKLLSVITTILLKVCLPANFMIKHALYSSSHGSQVSFLRTNKSLKPWKYIVKYHNTMINTVIRDKILRKCSENRCWVHWLLFYLFELQRITL
jgi:hypothetical protein